MTFLQFKIFSVFGVLGLEVVSVLFYKNLVVSKFGDASPEVVYLLWLMLAFGSCKSLLNVAMLTRAKMRASGPDVYDRLITDK